MNHFLSQLAVTINTGNQSDNVNINILPLTADQVVHNTLNIAYFLLGVIAVIVIIISSITYATSAGNASAVTKAKNQTLYAVVGIIVVLSAYAITNFIIGSFK